jgi:hypothetical protein
MNLVESILRKFSFVRALERGARRLQDRAEQAEAEKSRLQSEIARWTRFSPHGHFYSPLPSEEEIGRAYQNPVSGPPFAAVEFNEAEQFALFKELASYAEGFPFSDTRGEGRRFELTNPSFSRYDAFILYGIIRHLRPRRIIEVGCGYTSAAILDLNDQLCGGRLELTFIDPDLAEFRRHLLPGDEARVTTIERRVQEVPFEVFGALEANDILFLDTSHVSKVGSDVNHLFFHVLPSLRAGVWIHLHDIPSDLEYPREWVDAGRAWNEVYLLRAFLMYNRAFEVVLSSAHLYHHNVPFLNRELPGCASGGGCQMWLRKTGGLRMTGASVGSQSATSPGERPGPLVAASGQAETSTGFRNFSSRALVGQGGNALIAGFAVGGGRPRTLLIRAVGPGLVPTGVSGALKKTQLQVFDTNPGGGKEGPQLIAAIRGWGHAPNVGLSRVEAEARAASAEEMSSAGAFGLGRDSADSAMVLALPEGAYTAEVTGIERETGIALLEIYEFVGEPSG